MSERPPHHRRTSPKLLKDIAEGHRETVAPHVLRSMAIEILPAREAERERRRAGMTSAGP